MSWRLFTGLLVALALSALLAACGGSSGNPVSSSAGSTSVTRSTPSPPAHPSTQAVAAAKAACKRGLKAAPSLSATTRRELDTVCNKFDGSVEDDHRLAGVVCSELLNASSLPNEATKKRVFSACYAAATK